jgi:hypothetical protein
MKAQKRNEMGVRKERRGERRKSHVLDTRFYWQMDTVVSRALLPQGLWTFSFCAVWAVAGARLKVRMHHGSNGSLEQTLGFASAFG